MTTNCKAIVILPVLLLSIMACNSNDTVAPVTEEQSVFARPTTSQTDIFNVGIHTLDANGDDAVEFSQGQQIYFSMTVTNLTNSAQTLTYPDPGYPAYCIRRVGDGSCLWDSRFGFGFTQVLVPIEFAAFETRDFDGVVEQVGNDGMAFGPGDYEIRSVTGYDSTDELLGSPWHSFTISE